MQIQHHGAIKAGPEAALMEVVFQWSQQIAEDSDPHWVASSVPVGAGMPDLILATYKPEIAKLEDACNRHAGVLAYLRLARSAKPETIAEKTGCPLRHVNRSLSNLVDAEAVEQNGKAFRLTTRWRQILPKIIAVEAKVSDWRKAVEQASRNTIFVHYSYVALPASLASRVSAEPLFEQLGLGLMAIEGVDLKIVRRAPRSNPIAWYYYYNLALTLNQTNEIQRCPSAHRLRKSGRSSLNTSS